MEKFKYPSTPHLPGSGSKTYDDSETTLEQFLGKQTIVTEKMDGENATLAREYYHARSLDSRHHASRDWIKSMHGSARWNIPAGWRICGENMYAKHSIQYDNLKSYFLGFSVWNQDNVCLSWDLTEIVLRDLGFETVPVLFKGEMTESVFKSLQEFDRNTSEGFVVRSRDAFHFDEFAQNMGKFVRKNHVNTDVHWMSQAVVPNGILK